MIQIHTWMEFLEFLLNSPSILQVGTVLNVEDAKNATNSGAKFLMSPATVKVCILILHSHAFNFPLERGRY